MADATGAGGTPRRRRSARPATPEPAAPTGPVGPSVCSSCASDDLTRLSMVLADGTDVVFLSCRRCESREWVQPEPDGGWSSIPIDSVIARSARRR
ncbi:hypothetical protein [Cellulomonas carbonis]|uniref:hypothetical protein n=1 Tax=Cellulomonas carbonis TaxID=1386092 RepID=UPI0005B7D4DA|nr:hypothetical protein [Cellulomonas carbonis]GGC11497.1 hypothetical protein GCM10010972_26010 [Cellulomonas carbonis]